MYTCIFIAYIIHFYMHSIYIYHFDIYWYVYRISCGTTGCTDGGRPLFLAGNSSPTIPHMFSKNKAAGFPSGCAAAAALDGRRGSNIFEVNPWLWRFGRGKPRLGGLSIDQTVKRLSAISVTSVQPRQNGLARRLGPDSK